MRPIDPHPPSGQPMNTTAAILRAAELEALLALERTENARRLREIEPKLREFRSVLQTMHRKLETTTAERARLESRLAGTTELLADLERQLELARSSRGGASGELDVALAEIERLSAELRARDTALAAVTETLRAKERDTASLERKLGFARSKLTEMRDALLAAKQNGTPLSAELSRCSELDSGPVHLAPGATFPAVPGLRFESSVGPSGLGPRYTARESEGRRPVGVLLLSRRLDPPVTSRLEAMRRARHENLVSAVAFGTSPSGPYVAFERAFGETAAEWVRRIGPLPERTAVPLALQVARGLREAAFHGVFHSDLSPSSVRIEPTGRARVEDVGLAALHGESTPPATSPGFASSERLRGSPPPEARCDIYSLGAILFFLLAGRPPYEGDRAQIARRQTGGDPPDPRERNPAVSPQLSRLVMRMLATDASRRPQTWDEVLVEFERLSGAADGHAEPAPTSRVAEFVAAHPFVASAIAAAPIVVAAALLHFMTAPVPSARERFDAAATKAGDLAERGDVEGARLVLARFLADTGDASVEREAALRLDALRDR